MTSCHAVRWIYLYFSRIEGGICHVNAAAATAVPMPAKCDYRQSKAQMLVLNSCQPANWGRVQERRLIHAANSMSAKIYTHNTSIKCQYHAVTSTTICLASTGRLKK
jgi:hypothetical protein